MKEITAQVARRPKWECYLKLKGSGIEYRIKQIYTYMFVIAVVQTELMRNERLLLWI
jgi:hypothetical protein